MRVKVKTVIAGPDCNAQPKEVIDVAEQFGRDLIAGGFAEEVAAEPAIETAVMETPEKAVSPRGRGRKR